MKTKIVLWGVMDNGSNGRSHHVDTLLRRRCNPGRFSRSRSASISHDISLVKCFAFTVL